MRANTAIKEFVESMKGIKSPATIKWYEHRLDKMEKFLGKIQIEKITTQHLRRWRSELTQKDISPWTLHGYIRATRRFFHWLTIEEVINTNPAKRLELNPLPEEPPKGIEREEIEKLINVAKNNPRDHALVLLLTHTGARAGGIAGLTWEDISLKEQSAIVREKGRGGKHKARKVYFNCVTEKALRKLRGKTESGKVFRSQRGEGLTETGIYQSLERLAKRAGVKRWNPHAFRHAFARELLKEGANLAQVSQLLGHRNIQVTANFYARFADHELQEAHRRYHWLGKKRTKTKVS